MSITIKNSSINKISISSGDNKVVISFTGSADSNNTKVDIIFNLSYYPELSFQGHKSTIPETLIFNKTEKQYSKELTLTNNSTSVDQNRAIDIIGSIQGTHIGDSDIVLIKLS